MPTSVGQTLRKARLERGIELSEVERVTKIRPKYLQAIEADRWDLLPGEAYARGFLSTYAQFLGLDERELLAEFRSEHEPPVEEPLPETMLPRRGMTSRSFSLRRILLGGAVIAAAAIAVGLALAGGSDDGNGTARSHGSGDRGSNAGSTKPDSGESQAEPPSGLSLKLRSTGTVWVCLIDQRDRPLIAGETLAASEERGPFDARGFELALGNGSVEVSVDGEPVDVPSSSDPLGYRIDENGTRELSEGSRPTCL